MSNYKGDIDAERKLQYRKNLTPKIFLGVGLGVPTGMHMVGTRALDKHAHIDPYRTHTDLVMAFNSQFGTIVGHFEGAKGAKA